MGGQALNIERAVTGARLTNCSRTRHFTAFFFFFLPLKAKQSGLQKIEEKLSVSLRLKREKSQPLLAAQRWWWWGGRGVERAGRDGGWWVDHQG